ncbi:hypothetical protein [Chamaesiphon sp. VAR_48_metabat_403]|uniref:hypothetical protein n=1 Tax=Chamaesiphon sp. VAR_48_metabat_403 TaxID=2964700 RepID=UPI00286D8516|nr:hypothetical protein [Chamaesiphon sp. VAR_48_metabat_403]
MQTQKIFSRPKPILKTQVRQLALSIHPQPPTENRLPPLPTGELITPTVPTVGVRKTLFQAIDYDRLTPTQQARWDAGMFGSIELKARGIYHYYYLRWIDPETKKYRSTYLAKDWDRAIEKMHKLTGHNSL